MTGNRHLDQEGYDALGMGGASESSDQRKNSSYGTTSNRYSKSRDSRLEDASAFESEPFRSVVKLLTEQTALMRAQHAELGSKRGGTDLKQWLKIGIAFSILLVTAMGMAEDIAKTARAFFRMGDKRLADFIAERQQLAPTLPSPINPGGEPSAEPPQVSQSPTPPPRNQVHGQQDRHVFLNKSNPRSQRSVHGGTGPSAVDLQVGSIEFVVVSGSEAIKRLLIAYPESRELFNCLQRNLWVYGAQRNHDLVHVPIPRKGREREFRALSRGCENLQLVEVHIPTNWTSEQFEEHLDRWVANVSAMTKETINSLSIVQRPGSLMNENSCGIGGVCLLVTPNWTSRAFSDFNQYDEASPGIQVGSQLELR